MGAPRRIFIQAIASLMLLFSTLILSGCNPANQDLVEDIPALGGSPTPGPTESVTDQTGMIEEVFFDFDHPSDGLSLDSGGDVDTEVVTIGDTQEQVFRTGNGRVLPSADGNTVQDWYMQFQVDDDFLYEGSPTSHVRIEIEYLDEGTDTFNIQYDAVSGGPYGNGKFKESDVVIKTGTGEFKTVVFTLSDAYFGNRNNNADFRIADYSNGAETIRRVTLTRITPSLEADLSPTDSPLSPTEPSSEGYADLVFRNGVILTMEGDTIATAIAIDADRIMHVGSDAQMDEVTGSGTTVVDLEGRTIMPGFVDAHSHVLFNWADDLEGAQEFILSSGITTYAEMSPPESVLQDVLALDREGKLRLRVSLYPTHVDGCGNLLGSWYLEDYPVSREPGAMLQIPGVKIFNDGGSCNRPATSFEYIGVPGYGDLYFSAEELMDIVVEIQDNGYQVAIHALGDRAIEVAQNAIAAALAGGPNSFHHRIEHNTLLRDDLIPRYSEFDIVAMIFGYSPTCFFLGDSSRWIYSTPEEFRDWEWRWRPLIDANPDAHIAWHADTPAVGPFDPIKNLYGFITRKEVKDDGSICEPPDWAADDVLTAEEALPIMTIESAYALLREDEIGSLKAGKLADLIILSHNPIEVDEDVILDIQVLMTMVGGNVEYCTQGHEALCP